MSSQGQTSSQAWLRREIKDGLQALVALGLDGQPAAEVLPRTADIWLKALQRANIGANIESIDAPRLRTAFEQMFVQAKRWPPPAEYIRHIPPRPQRQSVAAPPISKEDERKAKAALAQIYARIELGLPTAKRGSQ
ncbi:MAG: hypothetical protein RBR06_06180 [Desulfuromonadaceae bacterium]|nr:hypothetical protein [Desulfuromonadaceae bacterium]